MTYQLHHGNCLDIMPMIERESIDAIVTDPPYGLTDGPTKYLGDRTARGGFMGKDWDHGVPGEHFWREAYRVAKPGAHLLAFGGTRTFHRLTCAIEDAGWEIRDCVMWVYGSGFPKSHDASKAIDREAGAEREVIGRRDTIKGNGGTGNNFLGDAPRLIDITAPATPAAQQWQGWGTALKPAWEPIIVARKPLAGTVAENVQRYGTGAINVDGCRIGTGEDRINGGRSGGSDGAVGEWGYSKGIDRPIGARWPANLIHDGSAEVLAGFPQAPSGGRFGDSGSGKSAGMFGIGSIRQQTYFDTGSAARFFYCAKASKQDRDEGCEGLEEKEAGALKSGDGGWRNEENRGRQPRHDRQLMARNHHPTVKPTALMRYLCRLVTPPQGVILDPFMGSGSTGKAAILEGFNFVGIDTEIEYVEIAARRIEHACEKVGIVVEQPMLIESRREMAEKPRQMILL